MVLSKILKPATLLLSAASLLLSASASHADCTGDLTGEIADIRAAQEHLSRITLGQPEFIEELIIALLSNGHISSEGLPGVGKTRTVSAFAAAVGLETTRLQCDSEVMPSHIIGSFQEDENGVEVFVKGPIFTNIFQIDEINRCNPRAQTALLEAMEEGQVTVRGVTYKLPQPFLVISTQNPFDATGTYPLPEAQLDRFMFRSLLNYPGPEVERQILQLKRIERRNPQQREKFTLAGSTLPALQQKVIWMDPPKEAEDLMIMITQMSRDPLLRSKELNLRLAHGSGTRGTLSIDLAASARAVLYGHPQVTIEDVIAVAKPILRHRILLTQAALNQGHTVDETIDDLIEAAIEKLKK